jgi:hypothetical protein
MSVCIEYGQINKIRNNANCCSWAVGDLLHYRHTYNTALVGRHDGYFSMDELYDFDKIDFEFMDKYFKRNLLNGGLFFLGTDPKIPDTPKGHHLIGAFHYDPCYSQTPNFHFIKRHSDGKWSERAGYGSNVCELLQNKKPTTIYDFIQDLGRFTIFKGWYSVPEYGIQSDLSASVNRVRDEIDQNWSSLPSNIQVYFRKLLEFNIRRNEILNNITTLEKLEDDFNSLSQSTPSINAGDTMALQRVMAGFNVNRFPHITHSPSLDLRQNIGR